MKKWLQPIKAVAAELTNMRQHQASCANWRYAFRMQLSITQMLSSREKVLLEKTCTVENIWGVPFLDKDEKILPYQVTRRASEHTHGRSGESSAYTVSCMERHTAPSFKHCEGFGVPGMRPRAKHIPLFLSPQPSEVRRVPRSCWRERKVRTPTGSQEGDLGYRKHNRATQVQEQFSMGLH